MNQTKPNDLILVRQAKEILKVSPTKMAQILQEGQLDQWTDPLDKRVKLVSRAQVEALKNPREAAA